MQPGTGIVYIQRRWRRTTSRSLKNAAGRNDCQFSCRKSRLMQGDVHAIYQTTRGPKITTHRSIVRVSVFGRTGGLLRWTSPTARRPLLFSVLPIAQPARALSHSRPTPRWFRCRPEARQAGAVNFFEKGPKGIKDLWAPFAFGSQKQLLQLTYFSFYLFKLVHLLTNQLGGSKFSPIKNKDLSSATRSQILATIE
ncbi:hypothetical protein SAMN05216203_1927 [Marinobacter daqiaonensis]|uniref:Uncharacterized protein n=1 Tax=Marinobacter daqiaonensis TaxID=650891 RepID=A0A1I6I7K3_9GAMM|nr:hypothetical protein SAMN05216203_1927 [Marinobacter daqiaonensis]